jgi:ABC-2 type transport system permease protein
VTERQAVQAVIGREFRRLARQRGRLLSTLARPLLWLVVVGSGFAAVMPDQAGFSYQQFLLPGIFGMVLLFSSMLSALGTVHDREFGAIRMLLVAPLHRASLVLAKTLAATLIGAAQATVLLVLVPLLGLAVTPGELFMSAAAILLTAFALASLGMLMASRIQSLENFAVVMNFVLFPMFFLSGALYPASGLPPYLQPFVLVNPLTYGVDLLKHAVLGPAMSGQLGGEYPVLLSVAVLTLFSIVALAAAAALFGREEHLARILLSGAPKRRRATVES